MLELNKLHIGHALDLLKELPDESIDCVITSPPYWSLRTYRSNPVIWGGDEKCEHKWGFQNPPIKKGQVEQTKWKNIIGVGAGVLLQNMETTILNWLENAQKLTKLDLQKIKDQFCSGT